VTPPAPDPGVVGARLRLLRETLDDLAQLQGADVARLSDEHLTRAAAERLIQVAVDLAVDVNGHLAVGILGRAPATGRESFELLGEAGVLDPALAGRMAPSAGLRNVLVHRYADIDLGIVAAAIDRVLEDFPEYVRQVAGYLSG
jgi:uncharacterized protein YutE (UPF0331/DUF86 family)